jgi:hypothetical protein
MSYDIHVFSWGMGSCEISGKNQTLLARNTMDRVFERNRSNPRKKSHVATPKQDSVAFGSKCRLIPMSKKDTRGLRVLMI